VYLTAHTKREKERKKERTYRLPAVPVPSLHGCGIGFHLQNCTVMGWLCCGGGCSTGKEDDEEENVIETEAK
jgi:hypothetical protein